MLIQEQKVDVDCEKDAQISILANKIATKWWPNIAIKKYKLYITFTYYYTFMLLSNQKTRIAFNGSSSFT